MFHPDLGYSHNIFIGDLVHLGFERFVPHPMLQPWVQCYWTVKTPLSAQGSTETLYPDGGTNLNFYFEPDQDTQLAFYARQVVNNIHFSGQLDCLGIRFHPGGAFYLLGLSMAEWMGGEFSSSDLDFHPLQELRKRLGDLRTTPQRLALVDQWLLQRAAQFSVQPGLLQHVLPKLIYGPESVATICEQVAMSRRKLERKFYQEVGLSPGQIKQFGRIKLARKVISDQPQMSLVDVAQYTGFYDQAHFNRQFSKLAGLTPGQYRKKKLSQKIIANKVAAKVQF